MNEPAMNTEDNVSDADNAEPVQSDENDKEDKTPSLAEKAGNMGHQDKDAWIHNGGDPDQWQSPEVFLQLKPALSKLKEQSKQIKAQQRELETQRQFYGTQNDNLRAQLNQQRDQAVEEADITKVNAIQQQIDKLPSVASGGAATGISQELQDWNADPKNDWYKNDVDMQAVADKRYQLYKAQNYNDADAIRLMETDIQRRFPPVNHNRSNAPRVEGGSKPGRKPSARKLTLNDLTASEQSIWRHRPQNMWKNEAEFLDMALKAREESDG